MTESNIAVRVRFDGEGVDVRLVERWWGVTVDEAVELRDKLDVVIAELRPLG